MELMTFSSLECFKIKIKNYLQNNEAMNCIFIGDLLKANNTTVLSLGGCIHDAQLEFAWMLTNDKLLVLTEGTDKILHLLADHFSKQNQDIYRIRGELSSVDSFLKRTNFDILKSLTLNVYQLDKMVLHNQSPGQLRKAELFDIEILRSWVEEFIIETKVDYEDSNVLLQKLIKAERLYLWENNRTILSMAAYSGPTYTGIRINSVFTPKHYRGKGYASSCVAALGNYLLKQGYKKCFILADQINSISNSIYKKIGCDLMGSYKDCTLTREPKNLLV